MPSPDIVLELGAPKIHLHEPVPFQDGQHHINPMLLNVAIKDLMTSQLKAGTQVGASELHTLVLSLLA
jgi:hypothetical protein